MIVRLTANTPEEIERLGGKACGLVRLIRAGLPVPDAWCITADAYARTKGRIDDAFAAELDRFWEDRRKDGSAPLFAVRSSATAEDLEDASFAGIYQTILGVRQADDLVAAVQECWDALNRAGAVSYRDKRGFDRDPAIALVIQKMVRADTAGVLMTANPLRPFVDEYVIDAAWGLGEAVVSGKVNPDHFVINCKDGIVIEERLGDKAREYLLSEQGRMTSRPVDADRAARICLTPLQLKELLWLGKVVDHRIGECQDIEWAFENDVLYVLQQRPITGLPPRKPSDIWSRKFGDEYLADYTMPLSNTLLACWISDDYLKEMNRMQGREDLEGLEPMRVHQGYVYFSGLYIARMLRMAPRKARDTGFIGWFPASWNRRMLEEPYQPWRVFGILRSVFKDPRAPLHRNIRALEVHCRRIEERIIPLIEQNYESLNPAEWSRQFEEVCEFGREHFRVIRWGMGFYNPFLHSGLTKLLDRWAGEDAGSLYEHIISGLPETRTAEINRAVWNLGKIARQSDDLRNYLRLPEASYETARARFPDAEFWDAFDDFIRRYGHRAATREIAHPRWRETPEVILGLVQAQFQTDHEPPAPDITAARSVARRQLAETRALDAAGRGFMGALKRRLLQWLFRTTQQYTCYRENQRFHLDYILTHLRFLILEQGRRFRDRGIIEAPWDIFFLTAEEMRAVMGGDALSNQMDSIIDERKNHYLKWKDRLPATYLYDDVETEGEDERSEDQDAGDAANLRGMGACRGIVRAPARVVLRLDDLKTILPGEILVTANIDPGWTNVFPLLAGLVTETGGVLAHGALLAREYGIPAVMNVRDATRIIVNGQVLEIDGMKGTVRFVEPV